MPDPYELSARLYDRLYADKDYAGEAASVRALVARHAPDATRLLDVGCGTGGHLVHLRPWFAIAGVDNSAAMLEVARAKLPGVALHHGDARSFSLQTRFDVVASLFSGIAYVRSVAELGSAIANLVRHVAPGGLVVVEPWFTPEQWRVPGSIHASMRIDEPDLKVARFVVSQRRERFAVTPMHHLVAEPSGVTHFVETHELLLATHDEYADAFVSAGLASVEFVADALPRGAWVGQAPTA